MDGEHQPLEEHPTLETVAIEWLRGELAPEVAKVTSARAKAAKEELKTRARALGGTTREECDVALRELAVELCGKEYKLRRMDAPEVLEVLAKERIPALGAALVLGGWTGEPPCGLRRSREAVSARFAEHPALRSEVEEALGRQATCARTEGHNRHGHCLANTYPGPAGWSEAYAAARPKRSAYVEQMRRYTEFALEQQQQKHATEDLDRVVKKMIHHFDDANRLSDLMEAVQTLGVASEEGGERGLAAILSLADMPDSRLRMRKIRKGWAERAVGTKTQWLALGHAVVLEDAAKAAKKKKGPATPCTGKGTGKKGGYGPR